MTYVELHCHSAYSFLDGASLPEELAARAAELGYQALALTDHDTVHGSLEFAHAAKALGVRPITGAELTLATEPPCTRHRPLRDAARLRQPLPAPHHRVRTRPARPGARSSACSRSTARVSSASPVVPAAGWPSSIRTLAARLAGAFGDEHFFVELQRPYVRGDARRNAALRELAETLGVRTVATGERPCARRAAHALQDVLVAIASHASLDACEPERRGNEEFVLLAPEEMAARFPDDPGAVRGRSSWPSGSRST